LSVLLLLQAGGLLLFYEVEQVYARWEMAEAMEEASLPQEQITLTAGEYNKCKIGDDELRLNGKMYDIRSVKKVDGKVIVTAVCDEYEGRVLDRISRVLMGHDDGGKAIPSPLLELLSFVYLVPASYTIPFHFFESTEAFSYVNVTVLSRQGAILVPPPKVFTI
jgi:hypothetical protein